MSNARVHGWRALAPVLPLLVGVTALVPPDADPGSNSRTLLPVERRVELMGTTCALVTFTPSRSEGLAELERCIEILEETEQQLSTWKPDSELSRLNRAPIGIPTQLSPAMCSLFGVLKDWQRETSGAFDPAIGSLADVWGLHSDPKWADTAAINRALARSGFGRLILAEDCCQLTRGDEVTIDSGGFGKGEGLDRALARGGAGGSAVMINLGGQVAVSGAPAGQAEGWDVAIAHPVDRSETFTTLRLKSGSVSTSGGSERDTVLPEGRVSHILDPRTGYPAPFTGSVTVWRESALEADILSTALYVMGPQDGMRWADERDVAALYLEITDGGKRVVARRTKAFTRQFRQTNKKDTKDTNDTKD